MAGIIKNWLHKRNTIHVYPGKIIQIIGFPRSGKTLFAAKICSNNQKYYKGGVFDTWSMMYKDARAHITAKDLSLYRYSYSLIVLDEAQLNGLHNRSWQSNLRDYDKGATKNVMLNQLTETGHYHNSYVIITHGKDEVDPSVRDQNLISARYICRRAWWPLGKWYCVAVRLIDHSYMDDQCNVHYFTEYPKLWKRLIKKGCMYWVNVKKYGALYDTHAKDPDLERLPEWGDDQSAADPEPAPAPEKKRRPGRPKKSEKED